MGFKDESSNGKWAQFKLQMKNVKSSGADFNLTKGHRFKFGPPTTVIPPSVPMGVVNVRVLPAKTYNSLRVDIKNSG